jgi:hypothetical protein
MPAASRTAETRPPHRAAIGATPPGDHEQADGVVLGFAEIPEEPA